MKLIGILIIAFALASCAIGQTPTATDNLPNAGDGSSTGIVGNTPASTNVFSTPDLGVLVTAPLDTVVQAWSRPRWSTQSIASAKFVRPDGKEYTVLVYSKEPGETYRQWASRSEVGNAWDSPVTYRTRNDRLGYMYESNDEGGVPDVHFSVTTDRFAYYFHWEDGLPENADEAARIYAANRSAYAIPDNFVNFVQSVDLQ